MNKNQAKGKLDRAKGTAKKVWSKVTGDDAKKAEGSKDKLHGAIQEKYGDAKAAINKGVDEVS